MAAIRRELTTVFVCTILGYEHTIAERPSDSRFLK
jgi:hypothetical protein